MKMIAAWGNSGAGKSTFALSLATALAKQKQNVVIISLDMKTPSLPLFLPSETFTINDSISTLLSSEQITYDGLRSKIHIHPQSPHVGFAGLISGENPISCKLFEREKIISFLKVLDESPFSYIIFDCDSNTFYDALTLLALEISDYVFRILTPDVKGYEFEKSALTWMQNSENFTVSKHIKVLSLAHETSPVTEFEKVSGNISYRLPFNLEIYNKFCGGELIEKCTNKTSQAYENIFEKIVKEVVIHD